MDMCGGMGKELLLFPTLVLFGGSYLVLHFGRSYLGEMARVTHLIGNWWVPKLFLMFEEEKEKISYCLRK